MDDGQTTSMELETVADLKAVHIILMANSANLTFSHSILQVQRAI